MRLLRDVPQAHEQIVSGKISLSNLAKAESVFRLEKEKSQALSPEQKAVVLKSIENKSQAEAGKVFDHISQPRRLDQTFSSTDPESILPPASENDDDVIGFTAFLKIRLSEKQLQQWQRLRELKGKWLADDELFEFLLSGALKKIDPLEKSQRRSAKPPRQKCTASAEPAPTSESTCSGSKKSRYITVVTKRVVWERAKSQCEYQDPVSQRRCSCRERLEIDHIHPFSQGGDNDCSNLRLLCREHNQLMAVEHFGMDKMQTHLPSLN